MLIGQLKFVHAFYEQVHPFANSTEAFVRNPNTSISVGALALFCSWYKFISEIAVDQLKIIWHLGILYWHQLASWNNKIYEENLQGL